MTRPVLIGLGVLLAMAVFVIARQWVQQSADALPLGIVSGNGRLEADHVDIATKNAGRVLEILADEGDLVSAGDVMAQMDTAEMEAQLAHARARLAQAEATLAETKATVLQRRGELNFAEVELKRALELSRRGHATAELLDQRRSARDTAAAVLDAAVASVTTQKSAIAAAQADVRLIETRLKDMVLTAPVEGRVLYRLAEPGEVLGSGGKVLTLIDLGDVFMTIFLPAYDASRLTIGSEARIVFDVAPEYSVEGKVTFVAPEAQFTPKQVETLDEREKLMFRVKVQIPPDKVMRHIDLVKTGIRGVAYVRIDEETAWPERLEQRFPFDTDE